MKNVLELKFYYLCLKLSCRFETQLYPLPINSCCIDTSKIYKKAFDFKNVKKIMETAVSWTWRQFDPAGVYMMGLPCERRVGCRGCVGWGSRVDNVIEQSGSAYKQSSPLSGPQRPVHMILSVWVGQTRHTIASSTWWPTESWRILQVSNNWTPENTILIVMLKHWRHL